MSYVYKLIQSWVITGFGFVTRPFLSWWTSSWDFQNRFYPSSVSSCLPDDWPCWGLENWRMKTSIITSGSDLAKPLLAGETSLCTSSLLFCAPEALALLSTACAHGFYTCGMSDLSTGTSSSREILGAHLLSTPVEEKKCTVFVDFTTDLHNLQTFVLLITLFTHRKWRLLR